MIPKCGDDKFKCPHCNTFAAQEWFSASNASTLVYDILVYIYLDYRGSIASYNQDALTAFLDLVKQNFAGNFRNVVPDGFEIATCAACSDITLWVNKEMQYPQMASLPPPNIDLDDDIKELYLEAASIIRNSPKGSTALLRLALQKLLKQVGKSGKNINDDIKCLVQEGLSSKIQHALDLLRVVGNNSVHPGQIDLDDNVDVAYKLFSILNFIAEELISKPKELQSLYSGLLPEDTKKHIKNRDGE
ncbi:DUF4145 domain-containing protein [Pseudoalteromonas piscicida]|uniref:DUF4145 domain-containing protein n=1 Tax=Pseudoalteromonas piscicida TaxID=43662 RepID=UPI00273960CD|nr:DUF4145 domain-containing protein [Pseudoalteromonas piscicida]MDP4489909.1 DUF4145 domain-containing protein [Pseudoalteromonas piscicida]